MVKNTEGLSLCPEMVSISPKPLLHTVESFKTVYLGPLSQQKNVKCSKRKKI